MNKISIVNFSIPDGFIPIYENFEKMIEKDSEFQQALKDGPSRYNHKNRVNTLRSAKIRFIISKYVCDKEEEFLEKKQKELEKK